MVDRIRAFRCSTTAQASRAIALKRELRPSAPLARSRKRAPSAMYLRHGSERAAANGTYPLAGSRWAAACAGGESGRGLRGGRGRQSHVTCPCRCGQRLLGSRDSLPTRSGAGCRWRTPRLTRPCRRRCSGWPLASAPGCGRCRRSCASRGRRRRPLPAPIAEGSVR